jgi:DNA-binding SARP family transcriptional activator
MSRVEIELLGTFTVSIDGREVAGRRWEHRRAADLVALLALAPGRRLPRDQVIDALWPEVLSENGAANLHKAAHHARRALGRSDAVVLRSGSAALFPDSEVDSDVVRFDVAAQRALGVGDPAVCAAAADLYVGELLPDRLYEPWTETPRDRLRHRHLELLRAAKRWAEVVAAEPTDEVAHRALMREHLERGDRNAAVRQFQRLRRVLADELGVRPSP